MEIKRKNLQAQMDLITVSDVTIRSMNELAYTASETEIIPFAFHDDHDLESMIKLVLLAMKFNDGVPGELRM